MVPRVTAMMGKLKEDELRKRDANKGEARRPKWVFKAREPLDNESATRGAASVNGKQNAETKSKPRD